MKAALIAAKAASNLPVICQMTYAEDGRTITGTPPKAAAILLDSMGADIIGANCSLGPDKLFNVAKEMIAATNKPIIIQPNAGMPVLETEKHSSRFLLKTLPEKQQNLLISAYLILADAAERHRSIFML